MLPFMTNFVLNLASPCEGKHCGEVCDLPDGIRGNCDDDKQCKPKMNFTCSLPGDMIYSLN